MSISQKQLMDRAFLLANSVGTDGHDSPVIDNAVTAELLFPHALRESVRIGAGIENEANGLKREHDLTISNGEADLPSTVLEECLDSSSIYGDDVELASYEKRYDDYLNTETDLLSLYTTRGSKFLFREAGGDAGEYDGTITLLAISLPTIPSTITDEITMSSATAERCIEILARKLRGAE